MRDVLLFTLPPVPRPEEAEAHWWRVSDGRVSASGVGREWIDQGAVARTERLRVVALAPAASVRLANGMSVPAGSNPRQLLAVARIGALEASLGESAALHAVSELIAGGDGEVLTAVVDNGAMMSWIEWARGYDVELDHVVPVGALLPKSDGWVEATIGSERLVARGPLVMPNEPALAAQIVGESEVRTLEPEEVATAIAVAAGNPPLDLRTGRFARRRRLQLDRARLIELMRLAALIPLLLLCWSVASIVKLDRGTDRLDMETLGIAEAALGRPVALEDAEAELRQRSAAKGGGFLVPLSALYSRLQPSPGVTVAEISYGSDGTLTATLSAASIDPINNLLVQLQRDGYAVTAVPRQSSDGRATIDLTIRSGL